MLVLSQNARLTLVIHPPTPKSCACRMVSGWNPRLARLSSHPKSKIMGWGFPPVWLKLGFADLWDDAMFSVSQRLKSPLVMQSPPSLRDATRTQTNLRQ
jgi:hypothetical protein